MSFYYWRDCPAEVGAQVNQLISVFVENIPTLSGIYLHGSLAMGCFNPAHSDIDLLAVAQKKLPAFAVPPILKTLLELSNKPIPIEISFLNRADLFPWKHPALYDLHFSEDWRELSMKQLADGSWERQYHLPKRDSDLAAHITITRKRGICLCGDAIDAIFPDVPPVDYADSILSDVEWTRERMLRNPVYTILNLCRVLAFVGGRSIFSKAEGGEWALQTLDEKWHSVIRKALDGYGSELPCPPFSDDELKSFYNAMVEKINALK